MQKSYLLRTVDTETALKKDWNVLLAGWNRKRAHTLGCTNTISKAKAHSFLLGRLHIRDRRHGPQGSLRIQATTSSLELPGKERTGKAYSSWFSITTSFREIWDFKSGGTRLYGVWQAYKILPLVKKPASSHRHLYKEAAPRTSQANERILHFTFSIRLVSQIFELKHKGLSSTSAAVLWENPLNVCFWSAEEEALPQNTMLYHGRRALLHTVNIQMKLAASDFFGSQLAASPHTLFWGPGKRIRPVQHQKCL